MIIRTGKYFFSVLLIVLLPNLVLGQTDRLRFERITTDNGLSSNHTSYIFQDRKGFIWISTQDD